MNYSILALLVASSFGAAAANEPTVYGKINLAVQANDVAGVKTSELSNHFSRIGVKGEQDLGSGLTAVYLLEFQVNVDDNKGDAFGKRNQYVGIRSSIGEILLGRKDSAFKTSQGKVDQFGDIDGDITGLFAGENRIGEGVHYTSPKYENFQFAATYVLEGDAKQDAASAKGASSSAFSLAATYGSTSFKEGSFFASVAYDAEVWGVSSLRATAYSQFGQFQVGGMIQQSDSAMTDEDGIGYMVNVAYLQDAFTYKAQFQSADHTLNTKKSAGDVYSLGVDYQLGKATTLYGAYTAFSLDDKPHDDSYVGIGFIQLF